MQRSHLYDCDDSIGFVGRALIDDTFLLSAVAGDKVETLPERFLVLYL